MNRCNCEVHVGRQKGAHRERTRWLFRRGQVLRNELNCEDRRNEAKQMPPTSRRNIGNNGVKWRRGPSHKGAMQQLRVEFHSGTLAGVLQASTPHMFVFKAMPLVTPRASGAK